ncbi:uncharacterized protein LOC123527113 [Mercenaria mercenaria]|uniref:uncharacterized protein LOC123527113 n=1 Tax=Mercenaria mercenaria TaxID=6596 RepID=UPI00234F6FEE|nr:uncharacterized protein LOC123527113 [Mercenaria mercenaria]XP_045162333.2 uncharacterized protein LOC123527113 [Mercenaria mercenaria]XP_045162334.2 uncharacterized protein LOC123527113 [Mercenaria mercenaria]XP_045162335.2 uncharacterized protein LOC123527113 [Mercenaria mercenaria]
MASKLTHISDNKFNNWIKAGLAILITKEGVQPFVEDEIHNFQINCLRDIRQWNNLQEGETCTVCSMKDLMSKNYRCPNNICNNFKDKIQQAHQYQGPSFKNTDVSEWCTNPWEVAKCYMPRDGYKEVKSAAKTDFNGIMNVVINHLEVSSKISLQAFEKGREVSNAIRHSPTLEIDDEDLQKHFDVFENILTDQGYLASCTCAQNALDKLLKLRKNAHDIEKDCIIKILDEKQVAETNELILQLLKDTKQGLIDKTPQTQISVRTLETTLSYVTKLAALKEDLITFYEEVYSNIPISPLVSENDVPVADFYVQQKMTQVEYNVKGKHTSHRTNVDTYEAMFMNGSKLCRNILIVAKAGAGKTTFAKRLCNVWCFAKSRGVKEPQNLSESAVTTLNRFDIVCLLLLRDVQGNECDIDEMIQNQIINNLSRSPDYDDAFLKKVFHHQTCLVILDGLDEWSHPKSSKCPNVKPIPHHKSRPMCTILSTTRPWKMFESGICNSMIDKCIELGEFDDSSSDILISNVIGTCTDAQAIEKRETKDFKSQIQKHNLDWLISTPVILIQLICLWLDNKTLGESKCQIYSNIIDFLLERAEEKYKQGKVTITSVDQSEGEKLFEQFSCLRQKEFCKKYNSLLVAVGKLAFKALCSETRERSLVFESTLVMKTLSNEELHNCLQIGILTENKTNHLSVREINFSFIHKTFQEYFCALYIATIENKTCTSDVLKQCQSIESILELSGVFVFLSGVCPKVLNNMYVNLAEIISNDKICQDFRRKVCTSINWNTFYKILKDLQDMYIDCIKESEAENTESMNIIQEDFVIDGDCCKESYGEHLKELVGMNKDKMKSVKIYYKPGTVISSYIDDFTLIGVKHLDKLEMIVDKLNDGDLDLLLSGSTNTLKCLSVCKDIGSQIDPPCESLSDSCVRTIQQMSNLEAIMLECFTIDHELLHNLFSFLEEKRKMTEICLGYIKCRDHDCHCTGFSLDLSMHSSLTMLEIGSVPLSDVKLNTHSLHECRVGHFDSENVLPAVLCCLKEAPGLQSLMCFGISRPGEVEAVLKTLPSLEKLRVLVMKRINVGDHALDIQTHLEHIKMSSVQMSSSVFASIVNEAEDHPQSLTCEFLSCEIIPEEEYNKIKGYIDDSEIVDISYEGKETNKTIKIKFTSKTKPSLET